MLVVRVQKWHSSSNRAFLSFFFRVTPEVQCKHKNYNVIKALLCFFKKNAKYAKTQTQKMTRE